MLNGMSRKVLAIARLLLTALRPGRPNPSPWRPSLASFLGATHARAFAAIVLTCFRRSRGNPSKTSLPTKSDSLPDSPSPFGVAEGGHGAHCLVVILPQFWGVLESLSIVIASIITIVITIFTIIYLYIYILYISYAESYA